MAKVAAGLACAGLLAACTDSAHGPPAPPSASMSAGSAASAKVAWPNTDLPGTDCGTFVHAQGERSSPEAAQCLVDAATAKRPAHLIETAPTREGALITTYSLTDDRGRTTVLVDARKNVAAVSGDAGGSGDPDGSGDPARADADLGPVTITTCTRTCSPVVYLWPLRSKSYKAVNYDALRLLAVDHECGGRSPYVERTDLKGLTLAQAETIEKAGRRRVRVVGQDGTCAAGNDDLRVDRTNLYIRNGRVDWAQMG